VEGDAMSKGMKNIYTCNTCHGQIVTVDIDEGTTPFMMFCKVTKGCNGDMYSSFYRCDQSLTATFEFFKPTSLEGYSPEMREHIEMGGLDLRECGGSVSVIDRKNRKKRKRSRKKHLTN
jgi:hypothetical protein